MKNFGYSLAAFTLALTVMAGEVMAAGGAHGAEHGSGGGGLPQLDPTWYPSQIFWLLAVFGTLYFIFAKTVLPQISATLENRHSHIQNDLDSAQTLKDQAEEIHAAYEKILNEAREKANQIFADVEESLKDDAAKKTETFRLRMQVEIEKAEKRIEKSKKEAMEQMNTIAAEMASEAAKKIVGISTDLDKAKDVVKDLSDKAKAA